MNTTFNIFWDHAQHYRPLENIKENIDCLSVQFASPSVCQIILYLQITLSRVYYVTILYMYT